ncbi:hypothetical protein PDE_08489 [Penicillium oxalicum 114-2]|uniref:Uncharacterized protein n=1 Tax=Penicillium oxalicum (strain 114-2 / CGMCC 5302) TaxID=933388 RepID=S8BEN4_PENO1|nr:hypothetical protein PDE_08489 [Penicillium oxalicum 114-2]
MKQTHRIDKTHPFRMFIAGHCQLRVLLERFTPQGKEKSTRDGTTVGKWRRQEPTEDRRARERRGRNMWSRVAGTGTPPSRPQCVTSRFQRVRKACFPCRTGIEARKSKRTKAGWYQSSTATHHVTHKHVANRISVAEHKVIN